MPREVALALAVGTTVFFAVPTMYHRLLVSGSAALPQCDQLRLEALTGRRVIELRLVDDQRRTLDARDDSALDEVAVRGPHVFAGYLNRPDATAAVKDADGWFFTGDLACMKPDGQVRIVGRRATDLIKCGGYKVGAGEVEAALLEHPCVREVAVLGAPDPEPQVLQDFVASQLSPHKRPREVHVIDELPRNAMGKVVKAKLRER